MRVWVKVNDALFELAPGADLEHLRRVLVDAMRDAPAFVSFTTVEGGETSVLIASSTTVVLEENEDRVIEAELVEIHDWNDQAITWGYE